LAAIAACGLSVPIVTVLLSSDAEFQLRVSELRKVAHK
jgi:hypothetical protein